MRAMIRGLGAVAFATMLAACMGSRPEEHTAEAASAEDQVDCYYDVFIPCEDRAQAAYLAALAECQRNATCRGEAELQRNLDMADCDSEYQGCLTGEPGL